MSRGMRLSHLADGLFAVPHGPDPDITGLTADSRRIRPGDAFVAVPGLSAHGLRYLNTEQAEAAAVVLYEPPVPQDCAVPVRAVPVAGLSGLLGSLAERYYGAPSRSMHMVGVTGTNGKTSTVQLLAQSFTRLGECAGTIGTLGIGLHGRLQAGERTTPDVIAVHRALADMHAGGAQAVAMEVSSHALAQGRVDAVAFDGAVFSNLTQDHLDYHGSMQDYFEAKARLFAWPGLDYAVVNIDDAYGRALVARAMSARRVITTSSQAREATLQASAILLGLDGLHCRLTHGGESAALHSPLLGRFNVDNLLAVAGVLLARGHALDEIVRILHGLRPIDGRMGRLGGTDGRPLVVVDYAHTPDALQQVLETLRAHSTARLLCVFGCGGDRDRGKRPLMAAAAEQWADLVWVTDDNPRSEPGDAIVAGILAGFRHPEAVRVQRDRRLAIAEAIASASPQDIVLIAGKGHETYQETDGVRAPFDDFAVASGLLQEAA